jgi:hypothetical protein
VVLIQTDSGHLFAVYTPWGLKPAGNTTNLWSMWSRDGFVYNMVRHTLRITTVHAWPTLTCVSTCHFRQ